MAGKAVTQVTTSATGAVSTKARVPAMAREHTGGRAGDQVQSNIARELAGVRSSPRAQGMTTVKAVSFPASGNVTISHRLGRAYQGWQLHTHKGGIAVAYEAPASSNADPTRFLVLTSGSSAVGGSGFTSDVDVW